VGEGDIFPVLVVFQCEGWSGYLSVTVCLVVWIQSICGLGGKWYGGYGGLQVGVNVTSTCCAGGGC